LVGARGEKEKTIRKICLAEDGERNEKKRSLESPEPEYLHEKEETRKNIQKQNAKKETITHSVGQGLRLIWRGGGEKLLEGFETWVDQRIKPVKLWKGMPSDKHIDSGGSR